MSEVLHTLRKVEFGGRSTYIVCSTPNNALIAISNFLLLRDGLPSGKFSVKVDGCLRVSQVRLINLVHNELKLRLTEDVKEGKILQQDVNSLMSTAKALIEQLADKLDYYPCFERLFSPYLNCFNCALKFFLHLPS